MSRDRWTISLVLLNALLSINAEIERYQQENLQNGGPLEMIMLPQDCFEVCNDYECLYLCPQHSRSVKRCITPLKSTKKNCCQNGQAELSSGTDPLKTAGKHIWQAREQLLGIKKGIENDLANRRYSLLKGLQPLSLKLHNRDSLSKLGTKTSKLKSNTAPLICPVNSIKKTTNPPNNCVNTKQAVSGDGADEDTENRVPIKLPFYNEKELSKESDNGQIPDNIDEPGEIPLATTIVPIMRIENIEDTRKQVGAPNSDLVVEGKEETEGRFTDDIDGTEILGAQGNENTDLSKSSYYYGCNSPNVGQSNYEHVVNQQEPLSSSVTDQQNNNNYEQTITNGGETETMGQNIFQPVPIIYYVDSYRGGPMEIKNSVLPQTDQDDFLYTTPSIYVHSPSDTIKQSKLGNEEKIEHVNVNSGETPDSILTEFQNPIITTAESIGEKHSEINENILIESNDDFISNNSKPYSYTGNEETFSQFPTKESSMPKISSIEKSTTFKTNLLSEKIPSDGLEQVLEESSLGSEDNEHQPLTPTKVNKTDINFTLSDETYVPKKTNYLNTSENNFYVVTEGSSGKMNDTDRSYGHLNDDSSSKVNEKSETNERISEMNLSSVGNGFQDDDKKGELIESENNFYAVTKVSSEKMNDSERSYNHLNDDSSSKLNNKLETNERISEMNLASVGDRFQADDKRSELNESENNFYAVTEGSSEKMNDTERSYNHLNDDSSSNVNEKSETNLSSRGDGFQADKKSLMDIIKLSASANNQKQNYTYRILQELISKYNITSDLKEGGTNAQEYQTLNSSLDQETSKHFFTQESPIINSNPTDLSANVLKIKNKPSENESNFAIYNTTFDLYSSNLINDGTNTDVINHDVQNETKKEYTYDEQLLSDPNNGSTIGIHNGGKKTVEGSSNILESLRIKDELGGSNGITYPSESATPGTLEIITSSTRDNITIGDNVNGISLDNGTARGNWTLISSPHTEVSRAEQATTAAGGYLAQRGSINNTSDINDYQLDFHQNLLEKNVLYNQTENQFNVESNIEQPMFENNFTTGNESVDKMKYLDIVEQQLLFDEGNSESRNINSTNSDQLVNISVNGSIDNRLNNETEVYNLYDKTENILQLIPNVSDILLPTTLDDGRIEIEKPGIEEVHLRLQENNENSTSNIENDDSENELYRPKNPDDISTELNDSPSYTLEDNKDDNTKGKKKLSDIINTELNSIKQENIVLKKREDEEEMFYNDEPQCDCDYPMSREENPITDPSFGQPMANSYLPHPIYIVVPVPYPVCGCGNNTNYDNLNNNNINSLDRYVSRKHSEPLTDKPIYDNFQFEREREAARAPPYIPNMFFPFMPWGGMYSVVHPYRQLIDPQNMNHLHSRDSMTKRNEKLDTTTENNLSGNGLQDYKIGDIAELHQEPVSEIQRFSRNELEETGINEYEFVEGQYVRVSKDDKFRKNDAEEDKTKETPTIVTEKPMRDTSTASYIYASQESFPADELLTSIILNSKEEGEAPVHYYYPANFGGIQNRYYSYFPGYYFTHRR